MSDSQIKLGLPDTELRVAFDGPAIATNKFFVTVGPAGVRIAFAEQWSDVAPPEFRCAIMTNLEDAIKLKELLAQLLAPLEMQAKSAQQNLAGKADGTP